MRLEPWQIYGDITNEGNLIQFNDGQQVGGAASTVSLGATGAAASVGWTGIGTPGLEVNGSGTITQEATNTGIVTLRDGKIATDGADLFTLTGPASAAAASATGASASVAVRAIESPNFGMADGASIGNINQTVFEERSTGGIEVLNSRTEIASGELLGTASSVSVAGTGASASVGTSVVKSGSFGGVEIGLVNQDVTSESGVRTEFAKVTTSDLSGSGTLASISAGGALASVGESFVESSVVGGSTLDNVSQTSTGASGVTVRRADLQTGDIIGNSASARIAATGAAATVSSSAIGSEVAEATQFGTVTQEVVSSARTDIAGFARTVTAGDLSGDGASATIGATAAAASVSASLVDTTAASALPSFEAIDQEATSSGLFYAGNNAVEVGDLTGTAAGAQVALTGATTSVSVSLVNAQRLADGGASFDTITSSAQRTGSADFVVGESVTGVATPNTVTTGDLIGNAASASVSATGASASVSETMIAAGPARISARNETGRIEAAAHNESDIRHVNSVVSTGTLEGAATSARIGTTGAAASFSSTVVDGSGRSMRVQGGLEQTAVNLGDLSTDNARVTVGTESEPLDVSGNAASAGISTVGASMSAGGTRVDAATGGAELRINGGIAQSGSNEGAVALSDSGVIVGNLSGAAASASASATGLSASVSMSNIGSGEVGSVARQFGLVTQTISQGTEGAPLTNSGTVSVTDASITSNEISGPAASAGISARGATGSVNLSSIATTESGVGSGDLAESVLGSTGGINQYITNDAAGAVSISDSNIAAGGISGAGASASISAVGASAGVSVSTIVADSVVQASFTGPITQSAVNNAPVTVTGNSVNVGGDISGNGSSAGISAVGASASISFSTIN